jgi:hypothetical protein
MNNFAALSGLLIPESQDTTQTCEQHAVRVVQAETHFGRNYLELLDSSMRYKNACLEHTHPQPEPKIHKWPLRYGYP